MDTRSWFINFMIDVLPTMETIVLDIYLIIK